MNLALQVAAVLLIFEMVLLGVAFYRHQEHADNPSYIYGWPLVVAAGLTLFGLFVVLGGGGVL